MLIIPLLISSCGAAVVALATLYWFYPSILYSCYKRFGGYLLAGLHRKQLTVNGITYAYFERLPVALVKDAPAVLFLHGFTADKTMWMLTIRNLPKEWWIIVLDLPGHGDTSFVQNGDYSPTGMVTKLHEVIEAINIHHVHLIGTSLGALYAMVYASKHPSKVATLSLLCPPVAHKLPDGVRTEFFESLESSGTNLLLPTTVEGFHRMIDTVLHQSNKFKFHRRLSEVLLDERMQKYESFKEIQQDLIKDTDNASSRAVETVEGLMMNTLLVWGEHDKICHPSGAALLHKLIKNSEVVMIKNCGHTIALEKPRETANIIANFLSRNCPTQASDCKDD
ncbi:hypothetical protein EMCRGX_G034109 [Ephydatia muelleri]